MNIRSTFTTGLLITAMGVLFVPANAEAQMPARGRGPALPDQGQIEEMVGELSAELSLSENQTEEVYRLYITHFEQVQELRETCSGNRSEMRGAHRELKLQLDEQVKALLTDEQQEAYDQFVRQHHPGHGRRGERGGSWK